jgi:hypothetical protein
MITFKGMTPAMIFKRKNFIQYHLFTEKPYDNAQFPKSISQTHFKCLSLCTHCSYSAGGKPDPEKRIPCFGLINH